MARQRDYAAEYARRQARARERGFENYYAQRIRGGAKASPLTPAPTGDRLRRARGHASLSDLKAALPNARTIQTIPIGYDPDTGSYRVYRFDVYDDEGDVTTYWLEDDELPDGWRDDLIDDFEDYDIDFDYDYPSEGAAVA